MVYADSLNAVSANNFYFTRSTTYPNVLKDFERSFAIVAGLPCDILISVHPEFSDLWGRLKRREAGGVEALINTNACRQYVETARRAFHARVAREDVK
jgi:metallo-beta-lactamase class B